MTRDAAVIVAGGASTRMGRSKAFLDWGGRPLLAHVVDVAAAAVDGPVIVAAPADTDLPALPPDVVRAHDAATVQGPLVGLAAGLRAAADAGADRAAVLAVDLPLLHAAYVRRVLDLLQPPWEVALPTVDGHHQPLAAAWRTSLADRAELLVAAGAGGLRQLLDTADVRPVVPDELLADPALAAADPHLRSTFNANDPDALEEARRLVRAQGGSR